MTENPILRIVWPILASLAGAITALSFQPFAKMTRIEIVMAIVVGASFATFVGPLAAQWVFDDGVVDMRLLGGLYYLMASGSNILIPLAVRKVSALLGAGPQEGGQ